MTRHLLPDLWLLSDERNAAVLERVLRNAQQSMGFIYRHYHLPDPQRHEEFQRLAHVARAGGHIVILADSALTAREWGAEGIYGAPLALYPRRSDLIRIATAHDMREIAQANRVEANAVMLSPVFPTRSHPGGAVLGTARFRTLAAHAQMPVIALGGMNRQTAQRLAWPRWAAIDGLSPLPSRRRIHRE
ncbi:thiamine phosphate synthase [Aurantiacibacter gangjinensis]|uniref:Thiamine monophosphate synthase n=1 Tax=Aurantiacibacter gangjinensis TaxID=502682 RepID=A0A0G9ML20_9SPHN|nr:thiamine phosphate synthase [Aurantiacibacter gangjinensis]APE27266.1 Thiamin-phosphate pyrophosphorylase [Aurantiacibacter gangjinensis]KLE31382.1 thiamine monophosphate synthase [Aurantiacibacter gangjinensis]